MARGTDRGLWRPACNLYFAFALLAMTLVSPPAFSEIVRVRVGHSKSVVKLAGFGLDIAAREDASLPASLPTLDKANVRIVKMLNSSAVWDVDFENSKRRERVIGPTLKVRGEMLRLGLEPMPQRLELHTGPSGQIDVVTVMDLDTYLAGVLPSEMPASWPLEALKAQVVASRTYALHLIHERKLKHFHLESTVFDQVYKTVSELGLSETTRKKIERAIIETSGEVLHDKNGHVIRAFYHADCGGQTELAHNVWGQKGSGVSSVKDEFCPQSPLAKWKYSIDRQELNRLLISQFKITPGVQVQSLGVVSRTASHRIAQVDVILHGGEKLRVSSQELRRALGFNNVKSTNFSLNWQGSRLVLEGRGHGHGVGLCQYGAKALGERGVGYRDILRHYYPQARLAHEDSVSRQASAQSVKLVF